MPVSPTWVGESGGQRFAVRNGYVRQSHTVPRAERALEIVCGRHPIAFVHPRRPASQWRLWLLDEDQYLLPEDDPPDSLRAAIMRKNGEPVPDDIFRRQLFKCVCGRMHELDRDLIIETATRLLPHSRSAPAPRVDFRTVARVVRSKDI
jgi:hypothetical protein